MRWHRRLLPGVRRVLCVVAIVAFLGIGAPLVLRSVSESSIHFAGPFHSTDNFLRFATGASNSSGRIIALFDSLPPSAQVMIVVQDDDQRSAFLSSLVAYLAWPHPVEIVDLRKGRSSSASSEIGAVAFCRTEPPPSWGGGERFGDSLEIVPVRKRQ